MKKLKNKFSKNEVLVIKKKKKANITKATGILKDGSLQQLLMYISSEVKKIIMWVLYE